MPITEIVFTNLKDDPSLVKQRGKVISEAFQWFPTVPGTLSWQAGIILREDGDDVAEEGNLCLALGNRFSLAHHGGHVTALVLSNDLLLTNKMTQSGNLQSHSSKWSNRLISKSSKKSLPLTWRNSPSQTCLKTGRNMF